MARNFVLITADFKKSPDQDALKKTLDRATDWIQFLPNQWVLWTSSSPSVWYTRLKPLLPIGSHILICELNMEERGGRMPSAFWDFVRKRSIGST